MKVYHYEGWTAQGEGVAGSISAVDKTEAIEKIKEKGIWLTNVNVDLSVRINRGKGLGLKEQSLFFRKLSFALSSGVDLLNSLALVKNQRNSKGIAQFILYLEQKLHEGRDLAEIMREYPGVNSIVGQLVEVGQHNGRLDVALSRASEYLEQFIQLRRNVCTALIYPCLVMVLTIIVFHIMMFLVLPTFAQTFYQIDGELPILTRALFNLSQWMIAAAPYTPLIAVAVVGIVGGLYRVGQKQSEERNWRIPFLTSFIDQYFMVKFLRGLGELLNSGISIVAALEIVQQSLGENKRSRQLYEVTRDTVAGNTLTQALSHCSFLTEDVLELIRVGESSGRLSEMLLKVSNYYHHEVVTTVQRLPKYIEPVLIILLGAVVGGIVIAMFAPMMAMYNGLG